MPCGKEVNHVRIEPSNIIVCNHQMMKENGPLPSTSTSSCKLRHHKDVLLLHPKRNKTRKVSKCKVETTRSVECDDSSSSASHSVPSILNVVLRFKTLFFLIGFFFFYSHDACLVGKVEAITCPNGVDNLHIQTNWVMQAQYGAFQAAVEMGFYDNECLNVVIKLGMLYKKC